MALEFSLCNSSSLNCLDSVLFNELKQKCEEVIACRIRSSHYTLSKISQLSQISKNTIKKIIGTYSTNREQRYRTFEFLTLSSCLNIDTKICWDDISVDAIDYVHNLPSIPLFENRLTDTVCTEHSILQAKNVQDSYPAINLYNVKTEIQKRYNIKFESFLFAVYTLGGHIEFYFDYLDNYPSRCRIII